jgi:cell division protein FtsB
MLRPGRLLFVAGIVLIALLYWKPVHSYEHTKTVLQNREAQVAALRAEQRELKERLATVGSGEELLREARRLGFVKPGERLFIVQGIAAWRASH